MGSRGFTLAEALIASVILAIAVVGISTTLMASARQTQQLGAMSTSQGLARELLEEVTSRSFTTQPAAGYPVQHDATKRSQYDDLGDYDGYTDNTTAGIKTLQGDLVSLNDGATYTRSVSVTYGACPGACSESPQPQDCCTVTITVTSDRGPTVVLQKSLTNPKLDR
jgi:prepilin-type N-terminal cleavage/methylation domain-containing protein